MHQLLILVAKERREKNYFFLSTTVLFSDIFLLGLEKVPSASLGHVDFAAGQSNNFSSLLADWAKVQARHLLTKIINYDEQVVASVQQNLRASNPKDKLEFIFFSEPDYCLLFSVLDICLPFFVSRLNFLFLFFTSCSPYSGTSM